MLVMVWGLEADRPAAAVLQHLREMGVPVRFIDQRDVLETEIELESGSQVSGCITICGEANGAEPSYESCTKCIWIAMATTATTRE